jgi:septum formation protein
MMLVLASASPARLGVLRTAGLDPRVVVSDVDEDLVLARLAAAPAEDRVRALAEAKADAVAALLGGLGGLGGLGRLGGLGDDAVVIGCDSMLLIDGELQGKPVDAAQARVRWKQMSGRAAMLLTGHAVRRVVAGRVVGSAAAVGSTVVRMGRPTDAELVAYLSTGEPLRVARRRGAAAGRPSCGGAGGRRRAGRRALCEVLRFRGTTGSSPGRRAGGGLRRPARRCRKEPGRRTRASRRPARA